MEFLPYISKWTEVLLRFAHVFFAIIWVGNSYLFNYLDNKMRKNIKNEEVDVEGILQHSGYYYKLTRYHGAPKEIPKNNVHYWNVIVDYYLLCQCKYFND